jgi:hypothetical protein
MQFVAANALVIGVAMALGVFIGLAADAGFPPENVLSPQPAPL